MNLNLIENAFNRRCMKKSILLQSASKALRFLIAFYGMLFLIHDLLDEHKINALILYVILWFALYLNATIKVEK